MGRSVLQVYTRPAAIQGLQSSMSATDPFSVRWSHLCMHRALLAGKLPSCVQRMGLTESEPYLSKRWGPASNGFSGRKRACLLELLVR